MESLFTFVCENADKAHIILFCLILLAGVNIPVSIDIILLIGGAIGSTCLKDHWLFLYLWLFFGCWFAAWEAYWIGRLLGPKLFEISLFKRVVTPARVITLKHYYEKFGVLTFIIGRFIPGGVRNALFMFSGLVKLPFLVFIFRDILGCFLSTAFTFYIGFLFGENYKTVIGYFKTYQILAISIIVLIILSFILYFIIRKRYFPGEDIHK